MRLWTKRSKKSGADVDENKPFELIENEPVRCEMSVLGVAKFVRGKRNQSQCLMVFDSIESVTVGFFKFTDKNWKHFKPKSTYVSIDSIVETKPGKK